MPEPATPSIARRLASMLYEALLLFAVGFIATWLFTFVSGAKEAQGGLRHALQLYLAAVFAAYFLWCWLRGGQTLAMRAWRIRLIAPGRARVAPGVALLRLAYATILVGGLLLAIVAAFWHLNPWIAFATLALSGTGVGWALVDRDRQFLHDRLAGTRLVLVE